jgi:hypothetical protein
VGRDLDEFAVLEGGGVAQHVPSLAILHDDFLGEGAPVFPGVAAHGGAGRCAEFFHHFLPGHADADAVLCGESVLPAIDVGAGLFLGLAAETHDFKATIEDHAAILREGDLLVRAVAIDRLVKIVAALGVVPAAARDDARLGGHSADGDGEIRGPCHEEAGREEGEEHARRSCGNRRPWEPGKRGVRSFTSGGTAPQAQTRQADILPGVSSRDTRLHLGDLKCKITEP